MLTEHKGKEDFFVEFFDTCKRIYMMGINIKNGVDVCL